MKRLRYLLLPVFLGIGALWSLFSVAGVKAQVEYFLYPNTIYEYDEFVTTDASFTVSDNDLAMTGICTYDGGWASCGAEMAMQRPIDEPVYGVMVDWNDGTVASQTYPRPQATGSNVSGQGSVLDLSLGAGCANPADCPSPYGGKICYTDLDSEDLDILECDEFSEIWLSDAITGTRDSLTVYVVNNTGGSLNIVVDVSLYWIVAECPDGSAPNVYNVCLEEEPPPPPPPFEFPIDPDTTCTISTTVTITGTGGTTSTSQVSVTIPANLMPNYSFEQEDGGKPANWNLWDDPGEDYWYPVSAGPVWGWQPLGGDRHLAGWNEWGGAINHTEVWDIATYTNLESGGTYLAGFYSKCLGYNCSTQARLYHNGIFVTGSYPISTTYRVFSDVVTLNPGENVFHLSFSMHGWLPRTLFLDDVFLFPVDESGNIICSDEYYDVPDPETPQCTQDDYGNCIPTPTGGAGAVCYYCQVPSGESFFILGHWIAWLGCLIRNLFSCSLRIWIMQTTNAVQGSIKYLSAYVLWLPQTVQAAVNWTAEQVVPALTPIVIVYEAGTTMWDAVIAFLILLVGAIKTIVTVLLSLISIVLQLLGGITTGLQAPPVTFEVPGSSPFTESGLATDGANTDKIVWLFMVGITLIDQDVVGRLGPILIAVVAAAGFGLIWWTVNYWRDSVSF